MSLAPFPVDPELTAITLAYRNRRLIADDVLPRTSPLGKEEFNYQQWTIEESFTLPDTRVGRKSEPNQVEFTGTRVTDRTEDEGLDDIIPFVDIMNAAPGSDPVGRAPSLYELGKETDTDQREGEVGDLNLETEQADQPAGGRGADVAAEDDAEGLSEVEDAGAAEADHHHGGGAGGLDGAGRQKTRDGPPDPVARGPVQHAANVRHMDRGVLYARYALVPLQGQSVLQDLRARLRRHLRRLLDDHQLLDDAGAEPVRETVAPFH